MTGISGAITRVSEAVFGGVTEGDVRASVLIDGLLDLDQRIRLESSSVSGDFVIVALRHQGASREGDFQSELLLKAI